MVRAGDLTVNGSLLANGAGAIPAYHQTEARAPVIWRGGGSGGSIDVQVNTLYVGTTGVISANGGAGGDGEDGQQNGIGFGMYDGGDGGGGGGGGYVRIATVSGGSTSVGSITASGGGGVRRASSTAPASTATTETSAQQEAWSPARGRVTPQVHSRP